MFGRKKKEAAPPPPRKGGGNELLKQMGIMSGPDMDANVSGDDDDAELEAELAELAGESVPKTKTSPTKASMSMDAINKLVSESLNYNPDNEDDADIDDPDLLAELQMLSTGSRSPEPQSPVSVKLSPPTVGTQNVTGLIEERISMYQVAVDNATAAGDSSKARRLSRGLKTLYDLLRCAQAGNPVPEDDIPPAVSTSTRPTPLSSPMKEQSTFPSPPMSQLPKGGSQHSSAQSSPVKQTSPLTELPMPTPPTINHSAEPGDKRGMLVGRRDQYRHAALAAKKGGDEAKARSYIKTAKQFDVVIMALDEGKPVDLSQMPPSPPEMGGGSRPRDVARLQGSSGGPSQADLANAASAVVTSRAALSSPEEEEELVVPELPVEEKVKLFNAPMNAGTILEALEQRLEKYRASCLQAGGEGNKSKARRMGRILKQYEDAVKAHKAGRPVDYADLPTPPGFPPIPCDSPTKQPPPTPSPLMSPSSSSTQIAAPTPTAEPPAAVPQQVPGPAPATAPQPAPPPAVSVRPTAHPGIQRQYSVLSRAEQQTMFLQERQLAFKKEALKAKQKGDIELAKKFLRQAMGFDQMIEAAKSGLPVDMSQVPSLPGVSDDTLEFISSEDVKQGDRAETYKGLEQELITQIRTCTTNSEHFTKLGDITTAEKFNKICVNARKDLESLKNAFKHGDPIPRFHYETRTYTLVKSCSDLGDDELQMTMVRGLNYHLPADYAPTDLDTYIKYELPFPTDDVQKGYSDTVKGSNNPEHNQSFSITISRKSRSFLRFLKHKTLKIEVYYKRGFFKGDKVLGTAQIKLQPLENACVVHDSYDLTDGRRAVGGKVEVKLRIREPFLSKQVEEVKEKWLIIDHFDRNQPRTQGQNRVPASNAKAPAPPSATPPIASIRVLEYEKQQLDRQIQQMAGRLSRSHEDQLRRKSAELGQRTDEQREQLRRGGAKALRVYADAIERSMAMYMTEASVLMKQGNRDKAQVLVNKKKIVEKEVESIRAKYPSR